MKFEERYSCLPEDALPQEIVLLMGRGCFWKKCSFCDYHMDSGPDSVSVSLNNKVLKQVTGEFGRLVVLNSGSYFELPEETKKQVLEICRQRNICHLHMESHWLLREKTRVLKEKMDKEGICLHPRIGIETFDERYREEIMLKGMGYNREPSAIAEIYDECCLLFGMTGQSPEQFDIDIVKGLSALGASPSALSKLTTVSALVNISLIFSAPFKSLVSMSIFSMITAPL